MLIKKTTEPEPTDYAVIWLNHRVRVILDLDDYERLHNYHWRLVRSQRCFYAMRRVIRNGKTYHIRMHREIMHTLPGFECHHIHHNPLDNRKSELENLTPSEHRTAHGKL